MGNYSADPKTTLQAALDRGYSRVRFQQGKPILDRELNLVADLVSPDRIVGTYLGDGVPAGNQGFQVSGLNVAANDFNILPGRCLVNGHEVTLALQTTYRTQPNNSQVAALPVGASNAYLHTFTTEIASAQDGSLNNAGDVGIETSIRERVDWEVLVSAAPIVSPEHFLLAVIDTGANSIIDRRRTGLTLSSLGDEITTGRGSAGQINDRLKVSLAGDGSLNPGIVSIKNMVLAATKVVKQVDVDPAPAAGKSTVLPFTLAVTDSPVFPLISVHFDLAHGTPPAGTKFVAVQWRYESILSGPAFDQHAYQILLENLNLFLVRVTITAYLVSEG